MLAGYDDDPVSMLASALRIVLDRPDATWPELVGHLPFTDTRRTALLLGEERSLDALVAELNEGRDIR